MGFNRPDLRPGGWRGTAQARFASATGCGGMERVARDEIRRVQERERRDIIIPLMVDRYLLDGWEDGLAADLRSRLAADFTGWDTPTPSSRSNSSGW